MVKINGNVRKSQPDSQEPLVSLPVVFFLVIYFSLLFFAFFATANALKSLGGVETKIPRDIAELKELNAAILNLRDDHLPLLLLFYSTLYILKQTFCIPGSVWLNLWGGSLFGLTFGFPLVCALTVLGASSCYTVSSLLGRRIIERLFPVRLKKLQSLLPTEKTSSLWFSLVLLRIIPFTPNWFLNLTSPILNIPFSYFWTSCFVGLSVYNFLCVQAGTMLGEISSIEDVFTPSMVLKISCFAIFSLAFIVGQKVLQKRRTEFVNK